MNISDYREKHGLSREQLGALIGVSAEFVRLCECGRRRLSPDRARLLEDATGGELSKHETRPDIWAAPTEAA